MEKKKLAFAESSRLFFVYMCLYNFSKYDDKSEKRKKISPKPNGKCLTWIFYAINGMRINTNVSVEKKAKCRKELEWKSKCIYSKKNCIHSQKRKMSLSFHLYHWQKELFKLLSHELHYTACCSYVVRAFAHMCMCVYMSFVSNFIWLVRLYAECVMYLHYKYVVNDVVNMQCVKWMSGRYENKRTHIHAHTPPTSWRERVPRKNEKLCMPKNEWEPHIDEEKKQYRWYTEEKQSEHRARIQRIQREKNEAYTTLKEI